MAEQKNKLIFTTEGRRLLVSQENGVRFAVVGAVLIQGLPPVADLNDKDAGLFATYKSLTLENLIERPNVVLGLKNVSYETKGNQKIAPVDREKYDECVNDICNNVLPIHYIPSLELVDDKTSPYGTYEIDIDRTTISWDNGNDISFAHVGLIAKQYAETNDASFNVDKTQKPVLLALTQLDGEYDAVTQIFVGGIQILKDQNKYVAAKLQLRMTVADHDFDFETSGGFDPDDEKTQEVLNIAKKISLVNNGLKTKDNGPSMRLAVGEDESVLADLHLNKEGSIATPKTLMVADTYNADMIEEQWNAAGLIHTVNKKDEDNDYKYQYILTSIEQPENYIEEPVVTYNVGLLLKGYGKEYTGVIDFSDVRDAVTENYTGSGSSGSSGSSGTSGNIVQYYGVESPIFIQHGIDEYHQVAVDFFGEDNHVLDTDNTDKMLFSKNNVSMEPVARELYGSNVLIQSTYNLFSANGGNTNNTLIRSDYNIIKDESFSNLLIGADANYIMNGANTNALFCSDLNTLNGSDTCGNILIGGSTHYLENATGIMMVNGRGLIASNVSDEIIFGKYNKNTQADIIYGIGSDEHNRKNALEFYADQGLLKLFKNGSQVAALGGSVGLETSTLNVSNLTATNITNTNFTATNGTINNSINFTGNNHTLNIASSGISLDTAGIIRWGTGSRYIDYNGIVLNSITARNGTILLTDSTQTNSYVNINKFGITLKDGANTLNIDTSGTIRYSNSYNSSKQISTNYRKFVANIYYENDDNTDYDKLNFVIGSCIDSGESDINKSPMYIALNDWLSCGLIGVEANDGNWNGNAAYYMKRSDGKRYMCIAENTMTVPYQGEHEVRVDNMTFTYAKLNMQKTADWKNPYLFGEIPDGYDEIVLNIYYRDIGGHDLGFPLVPVISTNRKTRVIANLRLGFKGNGNGEDFWFWANYGWPESGPTGISKIYQALFNDTDFDKYAKFESWSVDERQTLQLETIAMPKFTSDGANNWTGPATFGWFVNSED